jgi:CP family cyanate transporter-like MFS transporter
MAQDSVSPRPVTATALCALLQGVGGGLGWSLVPPLMPKIAVDLHVSHAMGGLVWGAASLGIALASPIGGAMVDRLGPRRVAGVAMLIGALACAARALAGDAWTLAATMLLFGAHVGFVAPAIPKMLAGHVAATRLGRANGTALTAYTLGTAITVATARTMIAPALGGWRVTMVVAGGAMALAGVIWLAVARDRGVPSRHASVMDSLKLLAHPQLRRVATMHFFLFGGYLTLLGFLPRALLEAGLAPTRVGLALAGWLGAAAIANFAGPWLSDRLGVRRPFVLCGAVVAGLALAAVAVLPARAALGPLVVAALGGGCFAPLLLALPLELPGVGPQRAGAALGLLMLIGQAGGFLLPIVAGAAVEHGGFAVAMGVLAVVHLLIVVPAAGLTETGRRASQAETHAAPGAQLVA